MRKSRWFLFGLMGTVVGIAVKLVRGRRNPELGRWEPPVEES